MTVDGAARRGAPARAVPVRRHRLRRRGDPAGASSSRAWFAALRDDPATGAADDVRRHQRLRRRRRAGTCCCPVTDGVMLDLKALDPRRAPARSPGPRNAPVLRSLDRLVARATGWSRCGCSSCPGYNDSEDELRRTGGVPRRRTRPGCPCRSSASGRTACARRRATIPEPTRRAARGVRRLGRRRRRAPTSSRSPEPRPHPRSGRAGGQRARASRTSRVFSTRFISNSPVPSTRSENFE